MPPQIQPKVKPLEPKSCTERITRWTKEQEQARRRMPRTMTIELKHKYTRRTSSKRKDDVTPRVTNEDITPRAKILKGTSLHTKTRTPRDKSNHVSASSKETAQEDDQVLHPEAVNVESTTCKN
eukprot:Gb_31526 [translate_table: standard]